MIQKTLRFIRSPLLHVQGAYFFYKMKKLPDPVGDLQGQVGQGKPLKVLMVGDSSALGVGCERIEQTAIGGVIQQLSELYQVHYQVCAFTGFSTLKVFEQVQKIPAQNFDYVIVSLGSNDIVEGTQHELWQSHNNALFRHIEHKLRPKKVLISAIPPFEKLQTVPKRMRTFLSVKSRQMNQHLIQYSLQHHRFEYVDLDFDFRPDYISADGFHPSSVLYRLQGQRLAERLLEFQGY